MLLPHCSSSPTQRFTIYFCQSLRPARRKLTSAAQYCFRYFGAMYLIRNAAHSKADFLTQCFGSARDSFREVCTCQKLPPAPSVISSFPIVTRVFLRTAYLLFLRFSASALVMPVLYFPMTVRSSTLSSLMSSQLFQVWLSAYVFDFCFGIEETLAQRTGQLCGMEGQGVLEDKAAFEYDYDLLPQFFALLGEGSVIDALDESQDNRLAFFLLQLVLEQFFEEVERGLAVGLDGVVEGVHEVLGQVGGGEQPELVGLAGALDLSQEGSEAGLADVAILVGEAVDRPLQRLQKHSVILTLHLKIFQNKPTKRPIHSVLYNSLMSFLTIQRLANTNRLQISLPCKLLRLYACGRFFSVPHYCLDFAQINQDPLTFKLQSPLLQLTIARHKIPFVNAPTPREKQARASSKTWLVSMNSTGRKRAHSSVLINRNRETIFRILNEMLVTAKDRNLVTLLMLPACAVASPQQIAKHVRQALNKYLGKHTQDNTTYHPESLFGYLDEFDIQRWRSNSHIKFLFGKTQAESSPNSFSIYCCHFYRLQSALQPLQLIADMRTLKQVLAKFDFFSFIPKLRRDDLARSTVLCRRFVRTLKWRSSQSEDYLVFLLNEFGHASMAEALHLFEQVAQEYCRSKL